MSLRLRLRTKLLLTTAVVSATLTAVSLFAVSHALQARERSRILQDLHSSVVAFRNAETQREAALTRLASLMADLPIVRALMTTNHPVTIQDASTELWRVAASDLLVLATPQGSVLAFRVRSDALPQASAEALLKQSLLNGNNTDLWVANGHLYEVAFHPIYFGPEVQNRGLGYVAIGFEIDDQVVRELSEVSGSDVAFCAGGAVIRSTLTAVQQNALRPVAATAEPAEVSLGGERFLATSVELSGGKRQEVELTVLKSLDQAAAFVRSLNRLLLMLGLLAVIGGSAIIFLVSHTVTRPLQNLVDGVRALGRGDYKFPLTLRQGDEVGEVTTAFDQMRRRVQQTQRELVAAERLATIGQMASSISHDLRHHLAAIYANAEFLADPRQSRDDREELYREVRAAVLDMTELIESLLEFSRNRESLRLEPCDIGEVLDRAVHAVRLYPQYQRIFFDVHTQGDSKGNFDAKKLERVFHNLLLNACAAVPLPGGMIRMAIMQKDDTIEIRIKDNGRGIPQEVREKIFEPFFSYGKENGTGLGLNVAQKIVEDHGGELLLENTSDQGTTFLVLLRKGHSSAGAPSPVADKAEMKVDS